jgi:hypothetical protein
MELYGSRMTRVAVMVKPLGAVALLSYLIAYPFNFEPHWFLFALFVWVGSLLMYAWVATIMRHHAPPRASGAATPVKPGALRWLVAAEDGVFLLPLTFVGTNVLTAAAAAILYTLYQRHDRPIGFALVRGAACFAVALLIVPQGIWMAFAAHAVSEVIAERFFPCAGTTTATEEEQRSP